MNRQSGFTLIELMVSIAILGILIATAIPGYNAYRQRAMQAEATMMIKQLMDSQIAYFLDHEEFFPDLDERIQIFHDDALNDPADIEDVYDNLAIRLQPGRNLNYTLRHHLDDDGNPFFLLIIHSEAGISLGGGLSMVSYVLNNEGHVAEGMGF